MRKIFTILSLVLSFATFGQSNNPAPIVTRTNGSTQPSDYKLEAKYNLNIPRYNDTTAANLSLGNDSCGAMIFTYIGNYVWYRVCSPKKWALVGSGSGNTRDTVKVGYGLEVIWDSTGHQVLYADHPDGYEGGIVTYAGTGFNYLVSPITLFLDNRIFLFPAKPLTLSPPNSQPRYDIFYVDTLGAFVKMGDSALAPIQPQVGIDSFPLTQGFLMNPGDTVPSNIQTTIIYDKNTEWTTHSQGPASTVDFNNTDNPYHSPKDILVSKYRNGSSIYFVDGATLSNDFNSGDVLSFAVYLNAPIPAANNIYITLYDTATKATNNYQLNTDVGFYRNDTNVYQLVSIPLSKLTALRSHYTTLLMGFTGYDTSGVKGMYIDYVRLQSGLGNIVQGTYDSAFVRHGVTADSTGLITYRKDGSVADTTEYWAEQGLSSAQTWEQTLTNQGSTPFTTDNTVDLAEQYLELHSNYGSLVLGGEIGAGLTLADDTSNVQIKVVPASGDFGGIGGSIDANNYSSGEGHTLQVYPNSISIYGDEGLGTNLYIPYLPVGSTSDSILSITTNGQVKKVVYPTGSGGSVLLQTDGTDNGSQSKLNLVAGTGTTLTDNGSGSVTIDASGATYTASNGLTMNSNDVQLGGTLSKNTTIQTGIFGLNISTSTDGVTPLFASSTNGVAFSAASTSAGGTAITASSIGGPAITAQSDDNSGISAISSSGFGINAVSTSGIAIHAFQQNGFTTGIKTLMLLERGSTSTIGTGFGSSLDYNLEADNFVSHLSNSIISSWTDASSSTLSSEFSITGVNSGTTGNILRIGGDGTAQFYGTVQLMNYTVSTLPTAGIAGRTAYVTDALTPTFGSILVGGGSVIAKAFDNGTNWINE